MPEYPDVELYVEAIRERALGATLRQVFLRGPFLLRTVKPAPAEAEGRQLADVRRVGKRIALGFDNSVWLVVHLMIAGRLHWKESEAKLSKNILAAFVFSSGTLTLTEAGSQHRAAVHAVAGETGLAALDAGGIDVFKASPAQFFAALTQSNHTLKRALTDPTLLSGIGNAYSDEILHRARMSPVMLTDRLDAEASARLHRAVKEVLSAWLERLRNEAAGRFPEKVTAFREEMAAHGRYGQPCPRCASPIQRIRYASNETNYCPTCQTGGKLLADRALSRLLGADWPRTLEQLENLKRR